jgi:CRISPR type III-A-associated protein Csm2
MAKFHNWQFIFKDLGIGLNEKDLLRKWITEKIDENMIKWAEAFGRYLAKRNEVAKKEKGNEEKKLTELSSSQLRKFFGALKSLQNEILMDNNLNDEHEISGYKHQLLMLKPQLAYAAARAKSEYSKIHNFHEVISQCIDFVKTKKHFKNFISLVEAIVAYHKVQEES